MHHFIDGVNHCRRLLHTVHGVYSIQGNEFLTLQKYKVLPQITPQTFPSFSGYPQKPPTKHHTPVLCFPLALRVAHNHPFIIISSSDLSPDPSLGITTVAMGVLDSFKFDWRTHKRAVIYCLIASIGALLYGYEYVASPP